MKGKRTGGRRRWTDGDARSFADGLRVRAATFTDRRKEASRKACRTRRHESE